MTWDEVLHKERIYWNDNFYEFEPMIRRKKKTIKLNLCRKKMFDVSKEKKTMGYKSTKNVIKLVVWCKAPSSNSKLMVYKNHLILSSFK